MFDSVELAQCLIVRGDVSYYYPGIMFKRAFAVRSADEHPWNRFSWTSIAMQSTATRHLTQRDDEKKLILQELCGRRSSHH
nr:hypothetical protein CFP56_10052 [Quercus suber]